ncbi:MAG TPA: hypothetical protein PKD85_17795, partial [Saprospiraceae bacterium]|nr:hypothetical protein [Saprospiraceae bacterium]
KPLRMLSKDALTKPFLLFEVEDAHWFIPRSKLGFEEGKGSQGAGYYLAPNPPVGASISYYVKNDIASSKTKRQESEKKNIEAKQAVTLPSWDILEKEETELPSAYVFEIVDTKGQIIRKLKGPATRGIHTVVWDMKYADPASVYSPSSMSSGFLAMPGAYSVRAYKDSCGTLSSLGLSQTFALRPLYQNSIPQASHDEVNAFWRQTEKATSDATLLTTDFDRTKTYFSNVHKSLTISKLSSSEYQDAIVSAQNDLNAINLSLYGYNAKSQIGEKNLPNISSRLFDIQRGVANATSGPTDGHKAALKIVQQAIINNQESLVNVQKNINMLAKKAHDNGGPLVRF